MAIQKRKSRTITGNDVDEILALEEKDITTSLIMQYFGDFEGKGPRFNPYDMLTVPKGAIKVVSTDGKTLTNQSDIVTTVGHVVFNKFFIIPHSEIFALVGWFNDIFTKKNYGKLTDRITYALIEDQVSVEQYKIFSNKIQKYMPYVSILANNHSDNMLTISKKINKRKEQLLKQNAEVIAKGDTKAAQVIDQITEELLAYARELMKDDPAMDMFDSGVGGSFDNNFKNMFIMRGAVKDPDPTKGYNIITSNYIDGIDKSEYAKIANTLAAGPYARSKKTELGGYWEKLFKTATQHVYALPAGTDCGTKHYITIKVTPQNIDALMYNYIIEGDKLVELTYDKRDKYMGKTVKMRYASMCAAKKHGGICNKCLGNLFYREGIVNIGAATPQIPSKLKLLSMKLFHDDQVRFTHMDPWKAFYPDKD